MTRLDPGPAMGLALLALCCIGTPILIAYALVPALRWVVEVTDPLAVMIGIAIAIPLLLLRWVLS